MKWRKHKTKAKQALDDWHDADNERNEANASVTYNTQKYIQAKKAEKAAGSIPNPILKYRTNKYKNKVIESKQAYKEAGFKKYAASKSWEKYAAKEKARLNRIHAIKSVGRKANQLRVAGKKKMAKLKSQMAKMSLK